MTVTIPEGLDFDEVIDLCDSVATDLARRYYKYVDRQDIRQELLAWCTRRMDKVAEYLVRPEVAEEGQRNKRQGQWILSKNLARRGDRYCRKEKAATLGYHPRDEFFYDRALIEDVLAAWYNGSSLMAGVVNDQVKVYRDPAEGGNLLAMEADVKAALFKIDRDQLDLLLRVYGAGEPVSHLAREFGVSRQAVEGRVDRAMRATVRCLGGENPYR